MADREPHLRLVAEMTARLEAEKATRAASTSPRTPSQRSRKVSKTSSFASPGSPHARSDMQEPPASQTSNNRGPPSDSLMSSTLQDPFSEYIPPTPDQQLFSIGDDTVGEPASYNDYMAPAFAQRSPGFSFSRQANAGPSSMPATPTQPSHRRRTPMTHQQRSTNCSMPTRQFLDNYPMLGPPFPAPQNSMAVFRLSGTPQETRQLLSTPDRGLSSSTMGTHQTWSTSTLGLDTSMAGTQRASVAPGFGLGPAIPSTPLGSNTTMMAWKKRRLSTPSAEFDEPAQSKIYLQNTDFPRGTTVEVPKPDFEGGLYMPAVRPVHPKPHLTAQTLGTLPGGISIERYKCLQKCRNNGTCIHFQFVLGVRRTPDGLICTKCSKEGTEEIICKGKRLCPFHNHGATPVANPISNLPIDYLATNEQKDRMVEILERAFRNEWTGSIEEIKYAMAPEDDDAADEKDVSGATAGAGEDKSKSKEQVKPHSAPAAMQTFGNPLGEPPEAPYSMPFSESFDEMPYSMHGYAFEQR